MVEKKQRAPAARRRSNFVPSGIDIEKYNRVVAEAVLGDIILTSVEFNMHPGYYFAPVAEVEGAVSPEHKPERNYRVRALDFDPTTGLLSANLEWSLRVRSGRKNVLKLRCSYFIYYSGLEDHDEEVAKAFFGRVGRFATFPFFRAFASQTSWASGADLPILPVLREAPRQTLTPDASVPKQRARRRPARRKAGSTKGRPS